VRACPRGKIFNRKERKDHKKGTREDGAWLPGLYQRPIAVEAAASGCTDWLRHFMDRAAFLRLT